MLLDLSRSDYFDASHAVCEPKHLFEPELQVFFAESLHASVAG